MKNIRITISTFLVFFGCAATMSAQVSINIFEDAVFYDGYAGLVNEPTPPGVIRFRNDLMTKKISSNQLDSLGSGLFIDVTIGALCDNYDRIGGVNLAFVPTGSATYNPDSVKRIEIGRFITPFFNKNIMPDTVPYRFEANNLIRILKSQELRSQYDFWLEMEVFGVPYAANNEVAGCSGRMDVFKGSVRLTTNENPTPDFSTYIDPLSFKAAFNNYQANATDQLGTTIRTIQFDVPEQLFDARLHLITSNHGAGAGGEEYVRRWHYVFFDGDSVLTYRPGGKSCEPYRGYNTQANGIYGFSPQSEAWWTSWNNWCPGDTIPVREIPLGTLSAGSHTFRIEVPEAVFQGSDGNFPLSLYLQASRADVAGLSDPTKNYLKLFPNPAHDLVKIRIAEGMNIQRVMVLDLCGQLLSETTSDSINVKPFSPGSYVVKIQLDNGQTLQQTFIKH